MERKFLINVLVGGAALVVVLAVAVIHRGGAPTRNDSGIFAHRELKLSLKDDSEDDVVDGRPFVDAEGQKLLATALLDQHGNAAWSVGCRSSSDRSIQQDHELDRILLGEEWTRRALGEHASIPAFAAFTIALMSNSAPPSLVQDALVAAMDEVRHARISFEVASVLLGSVVELGPLPPSTHHFGQDLTALGVAAAREGCIDETLSALVTAYEVETKIEGNERISASTKSILREKLQTIALEETGHSALAWRTVKWVCSQDKDACSAIKNKVFDSKNLEHAFRTRFHQYGLDLSAMEAWTNVHTSLVPLVLSGNDMADKASAVMNCQNEQAVSRNLKKGVSTASFMKEMADSIVYKTLCPSSEIGTTASFRIVTYVATG